MKSELALLLKALAFAAHKHRDQRRKDPEASPYINHPIALADVLVNEGGVTDVEVLVRRAVARHGRGHGDHAGRARRGVRRARRRHRRRGHRRHQAAQGGAQAPADRARRRAVRRRPSWSSSPTRSATCAMSRSGRRRAGISRAGASTSTGPSAWSTACAACMPGSKRAFDAASPHAKIAPWTSC